MQKDKLTITFRSPVYAYNDLVLCADKPYTVHYLFQKDNVITMYFYDETKCNTAVAMRKNNLDESIYSSPVEAKTNSKVSYDVFLNNHKVHYSDIDSLYAKLIGNKKGGTDL